MFWRQCLPSTRKEPLTQNTALYPRRPGTVVRKSYLGTHSMSMHCTWVGSMMSLDMASMLFSAVNTLYRSFLKLSSYWPPVARENRRRDWMMNLKIYSSERKHFWIGSCLSVELTQSAQCCTLLSSPLGGKKKKKNHLAMYTIRKKFHLLHHNEDPL